MLAILSSISPSASATHFPLSVFYSTDAAVCQICGARYAQRTNLVEHMKKHNGQTRCSVCHQEYHSMRNLRRHMVSKHGMSKEEVDRMTNKRHQTPRDSSIYWVQMTPGQVMEPSEEVLTTGAVRSSSVGANVSGIRPLSTTVHQPRRDSR